MIVVTQQAKVLQLPTAVSQSVFDSGPHMCKHVHILSVTMLVGHAWRPSRNCLQPFAPGKVCVFVFLICDAFKCDTMNHEKVEELVAQSHSLQMTTCAIVIVVDC